MIKKLSIFMVAFSFVSCGETEVSSEGEKNGTEVKQETSEKTDDKSHSYFISSNKIKSITATSFKYSFGKSEENGTKLYESIYNTEGQLVDSLVYVNNKYIGKQHKEYAPSGKLISNVLMDTNGYKIQEMTRVLNEFDEEVQFTLLIDGKQSYAQDKQYDDHQNLVKMVEYDSTGSVVVVSEFEYNEKDKLITKTEKAANGDIIVRQILGYDEDGNNSTQTIYNYKGEIVEKNFLKAYDENGNCTRIEKFNGKDSLLSIYEYGYTELGKEKLARIKNGKRKTISETVSKFDSKGNKISFQISEPGRGMMGKDLIRYNKMNKEYEVIVVGPDNTQISRKYTSYNDEGLPSEIIRYNAVDEPISRLVYEYTFR